MQQRIRRALVATSLILTFLISGLTAAERHAAHAAAGANVTIDAGSPRATIPPLGVGLNTAVWDANLLDSTVPNLVRGAGVTALRFPGGSTSDSYHWQTNSITSGQGGYANPNNTFDAFMGVAQKAGARPVITVNYGSNAAGTAGGDPTEAAAWVRYANATKHYGIKYWEIGNEIYGNGTYGANWELDLHSQKGPSAYAANALTFINDMKAADPTIHVGVVLTAPGNWPDGVSPDWNSTVLSTACSQIDFVDVHWYAQGPGSESDSYLLGSTSQIAGMVSSLHAKINQYCGTRASQIEILVTETNSVSSGPGKQTVSLVNGLFLADNYTSWLEQGVANVDWWDLHNSIDTGNNNSASLYGPLNYGDYGLLADGTSSGGVSEPSAETPFPPYYGLQMLTHLGAAGDQFVNASSSQPLIAAHAVKQANGNLALLLINKDPANSYNVSVSVSGYSPAASATVYSYGENSTSITSTSASGYGATFTQAVPPYSLTTVVLTPGSGPMATSTPTVPAATSTPVGPTATPSGAPAFSESTTASPSTVTSGASTTIKTTITDTTGSLGNGIVDIEVYDPSWNKIAQQVFTGVSLSSGQSAPYSYTWTAPSTTGLYTVMIGVFGPNWNPDYYWNSSAATVQVTARPASSATATNTATSTGTSTAMPTRTATSTATPIPVASPTSTNTPATGRTPTFAQSTTLSPTRIRHGSSTTIMTKITDTGGVLSKGIVDIEVYDPSSHKIAQRYFSGVSLGANQSATFSYRWTAPSATGAYTVMIGVFGSNWNPNYYWNSSAALITVY